MHIRIFIIAALIALAVEPAVAQVVAAEPLSSFAKLKNELLTALIAVVSVAIPVISAYVIGLIREKWKIAGILFTQKRVDRLNEGIINIVRGELEKLLQDAKPGSVKGDAAAVAMPPTLDMRRQAVESAVPKIQAAFKETLADLGKNHEQVTDMALARVEKAVAKPEPVIPAVMARS